MADSMNPTVVAASLDDKDLQNSINNLVKMVAEKTNEMATSFDTAVGRMKKTLQSLATTPLGDNKNGGGGTSTLVKEQKAATEAVKETKMSYDQLLGALQMAQREVKKWSMHSVFSSEELDKYTAALAKVVEYNERLSQKRSELALANAVSAQNMSAFDAKSLIREIDSVDPRLKQLNKYYADLEKQSRKASDAQKKAIEDYQTSILKDAWKNALSLPVQNVEDAKNKIHEIERLKGTLRSIDLIKDTDVNRADAMVHKLEKQYDIRKRSVLTTTNAARDEQELARLEQERGERQKRASEQNARDSEKLLENMKARGLVAQETANSLREAMRVQMESNAANNTPQAIHGIKELHKSIQEMQRTYDMMGKEELESPIGAALKNDIALARQALAEFERYNRALIGLTSRDPAKNLDLANSYTMISARVQQLTKEYRGMSDVERSSAKGTELIDKIQRFSRALSEIQQKMNRPTSLDAALKLPEDTIDRITYKIQQLNLYKGGINLADTKQKAEINDVDKEIDRLTKDLNKYRGQAQNVEKTNNALTRSWNYMKNRLAFYFTVGASTAFIKNLIEVRSQYEMNERALGILMDSAERGTQIFRELSEMSLVSPYTLIELSNAARQLTAYDIAAKDVVDTTRRLADMASAVGVPIERLTYALGQIKAYGYLNSRDARMFANAGIPLVRELSNYYTELEGRVVSVGDVYDRMKKKAIGYNEVMAVVTKMTDEGGKFFDFQAKMADTLKVRLANLTLAWNNMLNDIGKSQQGVLTWTISSLRSLFLHWKQIETVMYSFAGGGAVVIGLRALNVLLVKAGLNWKILNKEMTAANIAGAKFSGGIGAIGGSIKALATSSLTWWTLLATSLVSLAMHFRNVRQHADEMNNSIVKAAKEASESLEKYLNRESTKTNRVAAKSGSLSDAEAQKAWDEYRTEIELSTSNADELIARLMKTEDLNKRLTAAFDLADKIKVANDKLSLLGDNALKISQDSVLGGAFGEGLGEDLEDYVEEVMGNWHTKLTETFSGNKIIDAQTVEEADREMVKLADNLKDILEDRLGPDAFDEDILGVAIEVMRNKIKENEPKIKGDVAKYFDVKLDELLAERFKDVYNKQTSLSRQFLTVLKGDYSGAFKEISDDILKENARWGDDQWKAIKKAAAELKKTTVPEFHNAIDEMVKYMNSQDWRIKITTVMNFTPSTDFQRDFDRRIKKIVGNNTGLYESVYKKLRPKEGEDLSEWSENNINSIAKLDEKIAKVSKDDGEYSKQRLAALNAEREALVTVQQLYKQDIRKSTKGGGSNKDVLGESISKVTQVIENTRKRFKGYRDAGVNANEAITLATQEYGNTLLLNNAILHKFGIQTKNTDELISMDMRSIRDYYNELLEGAKKVGNAKGIEVLEKVIGNLNEEIAKVDYKKLTEGLDNELGKLKDEYELSIELDADPEMSDMFLNMFDIDERTLPQNIEEYASRALRLINETFAQSHIELPTLDLTDDDLRAFENQVEDGLMNEKTFETIKKQTLALREMRRKEATDTLKQTEELRYKLADNAEKIALKEKEVADLQKRLNEETREDRRRLLELQIQDTQREIDELRSGVLQMTEMYQALFGGLVERSAYASRRIAQDLKRAYELARKGGRDENGRYTYTDPRSGEQVKLTQHQLGNEMNKVAKEIQKTATVFSKLHEAFTKGEDKETDYVKGLELIGEEAKKAADGVRAVTQIVQDLGGSEETVEVMNDLATTMEGLGDAATGVAQIYNGDIIGGVTNVIKGLWSSISSWFDNGDKKITRMIEKSEREVKRLELAYSKLERAAEESFGADEIAARRAMITNIQLRLEEEKRQLALEESRKGKKKDEDAIIEHQKAVADAEKSLHDAVEGVSEMLLGSNVKGAAEDFVSTWVNAWRGGENTMDALNGKFDDMIDNMVAKSLASKVVAQRLQGVFDVIETFTGQETDAEMLDKLKNAKNIIGNGSFADEINRALTAIYNYLGIPFGSGNLGGLSDLQQGIRGITEDQAGALEAYWNANTQQQYIHTDLLTQIRDMMATYNMDVQLGTMGQILLQLQQSYLAQMAIRGIMEGWTSPSGMSVRVEMVS